MPTLQRPHTLARESNGTEKAMYATTYNLKDEMDRKPYSEQTGRFPVTSYRGCQYIMVRYDTDKNNNSILVEAMKNCSSGEMVRAYEAALARHYKANEQPTLHIQDDKCSQDQEFKDAITRNK